MKKIFIMIVAVLATASAYSQKAKLDEHYKAKKAVYTLPEKSTSPQVSSKEAMKMEVVHYNRTIDAEHMSKTKHPKFMALSQKEQMKREVVRIDNRPAQKDSSDIAIDKNGKKNADIAKD